MKHTLSEGDRMSAIMMENNIGIQYFPNKQYIKYNN